MLPRRHEDDRWLWNLSGRCRHPTGPFAVRAPEMLRQFHYASASSKLVALDPETRTNRIQNTA